MNYIPSLQNIAKTIAIIISCLAVDFFLFPINSLGAYGGPNTKIVLGVIGIILFLFNSLKDKRGAISLQLIFAALIAFAFSIINYLSTEINATTDYSYAKYFISFFAWTFAAYTIAELIRLTHGEVNLRLLTSYFLTVSSFQCIMALLIDNIPEVAFFVDNYLTSGNYFVKDIGRLYGIGASLDPAGVRFAVTLTMAAFTISRDEVVYSSSSALLWYISAFILISIIGNMISRTTLIGVAIGFTIIIGTMITKGREHRNSLTPMLAYFAAILALFTLTSILIYNVSEEARGLFRFGFEGFFNLFEVGTWQTSSTDVLKTMWVWPSDLQGWIIGYGLYDDWVISSDIGYCRFVMYSGISGMALFALFFIYQLLSFCKVMPQYKTLLIALLAIVFIVWFKVSTDIYYIIALLYWVDEFQSKYKIATA